MKKIYTLSLFLLFHSYFCIAQTPDGEDNNDRVEAIKMAYMTRELNLTPQEAQSFWPVYNNYLNEIKQARNQYPNDEVAFEKRVVEIKERYQGNFKKVLGGNGQRINKVYTTEKQFNTALRNEQKNRQQQKQTQGNQQPDRGQTPRDNKLNNQNNNAPRNNVNKNNIKRNNGNRRVRPPF